ncbi:MAG TPA: ribosome small subunit-dependent GTPase A [Ramlibacter sp.]|uniref:ribosome small subunit-dependent GTPase A n=1 Tax=Ramlibacter sp. TaxID=1917967 RepID=UPI002C1DFF55|nr:ribosome small subunit-dependent GTPase A [Ramlibacter sp.]HVZ44790.1 ribosome small subunit-dependent GTPase A [Ramlibacter sp.]
MIDIDFQSLRRIGLTQTIVGALGMLRDASGTLMRIVEVQREHFALHDGTTEHRARALPQLLRELQAGNESCTIGDWVVVQTDDAGDLWMAARLAPATVIARRANDGRRQLLASNVDTALLTMGLDADFNPRRVERSIAMVTAARVEPVVVLTKKDLSVDAASRVDSLRERLPPRVPVVAVNGQSDTARDDLAPWLGMGRTLVLLGSSGAGKSTLTNTLAAASQSTGGVRKGDGRGRHTTTARSLHPCADGACIIDTPGLRTWRPDADERSLAAAFDDIEALATRCRYRDCRHGGEPGCAVRTEVGADRLFNFQKLLRDARRIEMTQLERAMLRRKWKAIGKSGEERAREKRRPP